VAAYFKCDSEGCEAVGDEEPSGAGVCSAGAQEQRCQVCVTVSFRRAWAGLQQHGDGVS